MRVLPSLLLVLAVLVATELSFRVYAYGPGALNPWRMNSFNQIHHSGLVQPAAIPEIGYELKPGVDAWYKGTRFRTNSFGMRDAEYTREKPAKTFRIAVLGSSWTMGAGVPVEAIWHSQLEEMLNQRNDGWRYELLNFGVEQYGFGEIVATLENKVPEFAPDLILMSVTYFTPTVLWQDPPKPYKLRPRRNPFFDIHTLRVIDDRLKLGLFPPDDGKSELADPNNIPAQSQKLAAHLEAFRERYHVPVAIIKLAYSAAWYSKSQASPLERSRHLHLLDVRSEVVSSGYKPAQLRVSNWDSHPNPLAHRLIANAAYAALEKESLLPQAKAMDD
jgi:hypothetical protein